MLVPGDYKNYGSRRQELYALAHHKSKLWSCFNVLNNVNNSVKRVRVGDKQELFH